VEAKQDAVKTAIGERFREKRGYRFTAGQLAKEAGVSVNTARKYLRLALDEQDSPLRECVVPGANGIGVYKYSFVQYEV
jgi:response regulator of citrate/malate metabolism